MARPPQSDSRPVQARIPTEDTKNTRAGLLATDGIRCYALQCQSGRVAQSGEFIHHQGINATVGMDNQYVPAGNGKRPKQGYHKDSGYEQQNTFIKFHLTTLLFFSHKVRLRSVKLSQDPQHIRLSAVVFMTVTTMTGIEIRSDDFQLKPDRGI